MKLEPYLDKLSRAKRVTLTKMRISDHKLMIEEGRRTTPQTPREQRTCKICSQQIESEYHFLMKCNLYGSRQSFFDAVSTSVPQFQSLNSRQKFLFLMTQEDEQITDHLATLIQKWLSLRNLILTYFFQP